MKQNYARFGQALIILGVLAWAPYAVLKYVAAAPVETWPFLIAHLAGVIPGMLLKHSPVLYRFLTQSAKDSSHG